MVVGREEEAAVLRVLKMLEQRVRERRRELETRRAPLGLQQLE
jgi:hypothetical protein